MNIPIITTIYMLDICRDKSLTGCVNWSCSSKFRLVVLIYRLALISIDRLAIDLSWSVNRMQQADSRYGKSKEQNFAQSRCEHNKFRKNKKWKSAVRRKKWHVYGNMYIRENIDRPWDTCAKLNKRFRTFHIFTYRNLRFKFDAKYFVWRIMLRRWKHSLCWRLWQFKD